MTLILQGIAEFQGLVASIHKCSKSIEKSIAAMSAAKLCPKLTRALNLPVPEFSDVCDQVMQHQKKARRTTRFFELNRCFCLQLSPFIPISIEASELHLISSKVC